MSRWSRHHIVALLVAMSAIGSAVGATNESGLFDEANNIGNGGMLHAVHKRQAETKPEGGDGGKQGFVYKTHMDYLSGNLLTEEEAKKVPLVTKTSEGILTFNADLPVATETLGLKFKEREDTCPVDRKNGRYFVLEICKDAEGKCTKGTAVCYPGRQDPENVPNIEYNYALPNADEELAKRCNDSDARKGKWTDWEHIRELHTVLFSSDDGKVLKIQASYMKANSDSSVNKLGTAGEQMEFGDDGCVDVYVGSDEGGLIGKIENYKDPPIQQSTSDFWRTRANGLAQRKMPLASSLFIDMFTGTNQGEGQLLAFVGSVGCQLKIRISGPNIDDCLDRDCHKEAFEGLFGAEQKRLMPITQKEQLNEFESYYQGRVYFQLNAKTHTPEAVLLTQGTEMVFAVATMSEEPPSLIFRYPSNGIQCTQRGNFKVNQFVLAYNGRSECFLVFAWGQSKLQFTDMHGGETKVAGIKDMPMYFKGPSISEIYVKDQHGDMIMMGSGNCAIEPRKQSFFEIEEQDAATPYFIWDFILNPKRGGGLIDLPDSQCDIPVVVNLTEYNLLLVMPLSPQ